MGLIWSKEVADMEYLLDSSVIDGDPSSLGKANLIRIFQHFGSLCEMVHVAKVSRRWAFLVGKHVLPQVLERLRVLAWYDEDTIKSGKSSRQTRTCAAWSSKNDIEDALVSTFSRLRTLNASFAQARRPEDAKLRERWTALPKLAEPRVVRSRANKKCIQFVDAVGKSPVFLQTMPFAEPLAQPVTIICVAIAFDEVTYLSGVQNRFELCHAYPSEHCQAHERAPVAMTAHPIDDSSDTDEPLDTCVVSGWTRPGDWHVYTAVFNGTSSKLFVDGVDEGAERTNVGVGVLDGLTLGADHRNDFPLGMRSEAGLIPGVIAEVLVFGSILPDDDRKRIEVSLMLQHRIDLPSPRRERERNLRRRANAMLAERAPGKIHTPCPLRYLTQHHAVSWSVPHPISGEILRPKRIGARETAESSDW